MARVLYGPRNDDPRYFSAFNKEYGKVGNNVISTLKGMSNNPRYDNINNKINITMNTGIRKAQMLAKQQSESFGYSNISEFCKDYNYAIKNYEQLAYRMLEGVSTKVGFDIIKNLNEMPIKKAINVVRDEKKIVKKIEDDGSGAATMFWENASMLLQTDPELKKLLNQLVQERSLDVIENNYKYKAAYAGHLGEYSAFLMNKVLTSIPALFEKNFKGQLPKNIKVLSTGSLGEKSDLMVNQLSFSIKNYTAIRERFASYSEDDIKTALKNESKVADVTLQSVGTFESLIGNFSKVIPILNDLGDDFYTFVANALYYDQFGEDIYYDDVQQIFDLLVNAYSYIFMTQGTSKEFGYTIEEVSTKQTNLPGFMWFTGVGIVPTYQILQILSETYENYLKRKSYTKRSGTYSKVKFSDIPKAIRNNVDTYGTKTNIYGGNSLSPLYRHSKCYPKPYSTPKTVLAGRYQSFIKNTHVSVKLHLQLGKLRELTL